MELTEKISEDSVESARRWISTLYRSAIGKKYVMAITGFVGVGYVILHMLGNLQTFEGPDKLNAYAALLKSNLVLLWAVRSMLLIAVLFHIVTGYQLAWKSWRARPVHYRRWKAVKSTLASRTMRWTGPVIGLFIVFHLLHLTTGTLHTNFHPVDVYSNVVTGFQVWYVSIIYIAVMVILGCHMFHGVWSMFESVGINHPQYNHLIRGFATVVTVVVAIGFISIPVAVLIGAVT
jgi:succinate dehydrogenase / fumarate reductase cytochrome b subunit